MLRLSVGGRRLSSTTASTMAAADLLTFINASPSPFHAVAEAERRLTAAGFTRVHERDTWSIQPNGKYYVTRNQSAVIAFTVGGKYVAGNGFTIAAAHTDSPCLRIKPVSTLNKGGYLSLGVEAYGGGIWGTWFDRDLSVAGRVIVDDGRGGFETRLVRIARPICRVPTLAIHLDRTVNDSWKINSENHLPPLLATAVKAKLAGDEGAGGGRTHTGLVKALAAELGLSGPEDVKDFELYLYDTQPGVVGGLYSEFVFAPRLDNLCMTFVTVQGLINSVAGGGAALAEDASVRVVAAFDHEEVGSASTPGAGSTMLGDVLARLCPEPLRPSALARSILVSADMAHAGHPNYPGVHEENHRPAMHGGLVLKSNSNQRYATSGVTAFLLRQIAASLDVPLQLFVNRQDMGCGSTIGPIVATRLGLRTVDVGLPQLSMHSCREMCGSEDVAHGLRFFSGLFDKFPKADASLGEAATGASGV